MPAYKTTCPNPICGGHNFTIFDNNTAFCFNCGYREADSSYATEPPIMSDNIEKIREMYTNIADYYHSAIDSRAYNYLLQRGFNDKTIQKLKIGYCPAGISPLYRSKIALEAGLVGYSNTGLLAERITFPYIMPDGQITDIRGRAISDDNTLKYLSPKGGSYYRGAIYPYNYHLHDTANDIILTEGEIKADIAVQSGYTTLALPGMLSWRSGFKPDTGKNYILLFDNQIDAFYELKQAIVRAARKFNGLVKVATLPLMGKKKQDIDSFILVYGTQLFTTVVNAALPYPQWFALQRF